MFEIRVYPLEGTILNIRISQYLNIRIYHIYLLYWLSHVNALFFSKPIGILRGHVTPIFYLFVVAEDNRLFSISNDKTIKVRQYIFMIKYEMFPRVYVHTIVVDLGRLLFKVHTKEYFVLLGYTFHTIAPYLRSLLFKAHTQDNSKKFRRSVNGCSI